MTKAWVLVRGVALVGLALVGCGPKTTENEPTATDLAGIAESNVEQALRGTSRAGSFIADSATLASSLQSLGGSSEVCDQAPCTNGVCPPADCVTTTDTVSVADLQKSRDDVNKSIDDLMRTLREKVFTKENLESEGNGSATYLLGPKWLCEGDDSTLAPTEPTISGTAGSSGSAGAGAQPATPELDPDCVAQANRWQVRLRLSSPSAGNVDVELLLTASKLNPATLELYRDHVSVLLDLGDIKATLDAMGEDTGSLASLAGKLGFELKRNAELDYSFEVNVLSDVKVGVDDGNAEVVTYGVGASTPTFELRFDGNARKVTGTLAVGAITATGPLNGFRDFFDPEQYDDFGTPIPRPVYQGALSGLLAGLEGSITLDGSTDKLTLAHLGLGGQSSTLKVDQNTLLQLDVNAAAGRHFDLGVQKQAAGTLLTFTPTLDAALLLNFAPLANQITDISPALLNDAIHFWFDGQNPSVQTENGQLRVVSGTLNYTDGYDPSHNVAAPAGSCVKSADGDGSTDTAVGGLVVTTCQ